MSRRGYIEIIQDADLRLDGIIERIHIVDLVPAKEAHLHVTGSPRSVGQCFCVVKTQYLATFPSEPRALECVHAGITGGHARRMN